MPVARPCLLEIHDRATDTRKELSRPISLFEALPGEVRNQIFMCYIHDALRSTEISWSTTKSAKEIELSVVPQWYGPPRMRMSGIGTLPLLFVSKGINTELASLVYSQVDKLRIGGYILERPNENPASPRSSWNQIYPLLLNQHIRQFTKSIKLKLPSTRDDLHRRYDILRGFSFTGFPAQHWQRRSANLGSIMSVIPRLIECLKTFGHLEELEITVTVEMTSPPDFKPLLPLYDLCGDRTVVLFVGSTREVTGYGFSISWWQWAERWDRSWKHCLAQHQRAKLE